MVEFALVSIVLFAMLFVLIDLMRFMQANTSVAEAARQGARQGVANAVTGDGPFGSYAGGPCSGTVLTPQASGTGCLGDRAIQATIAGVLSPLTSTINGSDMKAVDCPTPGPAVTNVCIWPAEVGGVRTYADCASARLALGRDPLPGELGSRSAEWSSPRYKGCFLVQVTVIYGYFPLTPAFSLLNLPTLRNLSSSTTMLAEY